MFAPSREAGLEVMAGFMPRAGRAYAQDRNHDPGPHGDQPVSRLSPWIRHRLVLETEVLAAAHAQHGLQAAEKFLQEVCWRSYWKGWLEQRPWVWSDYRTALAGLDKQWSGDSLYRAALAGETGIDCFDAWVRELRDYGYLHNHARMWFASIWVFTLNLPWQLGADFFLRHLLDGDPASNTLSWRWVSGLQTKGKTYLARPANIRKYTGGRFDPAATQLAETAEPPPWQAHPDPVPLRDFRIPAADGPVALLLHEDDLGPWPEEWLQGREVAAIAALDTTPLRSPQPMSDPVRRFAAGALDDGLARAALTHGVKGTRVGGDANPSQALRQWAESAGVRRILTPWAPVGPTRDVLDALIPSLRLRGVHLGMLRRDWDSAVWPLATGGFFAFWKRLKPQLEDLLVAGR